MPMENSLSHLTTPQQASNPSSNSKLEYGHPHFHKLTAAEKDLHNRKNHDYSAGGHPLGNFLRVSEIIKLYPGLDVTDPAIIAVFYMMKQLDAYLWIKARKIKTKVEGIQERLTDVSVYAKLIQCIELDREEVKNGMVVPNYGSGSVAGSPIRAAGFPLTSNDCAEIVADID